MTHQQDQIPQELRTTAEAVDRLARAEAQSAPADMIERLVAATTPTRRQPPRPLRIWTRPVMALAASVALVATAGLTWLAISQTPGVQPNLDEEFAADFDLLLTLTADDAWSAEVDLLKADTAALEASFEGVWLPDVEGAL